jgi:hypothetical protein
MGLLTDFFVAAPTEIQSVDIAHSPVGSFPGLHAKRTDPVKLVQLQCCIDGATFEERMPLLDEMLVRDAGQEGPWIFRVPQTLSDALASAGPADIQTHGRAWAATDEWRADGGTEAELVPYLSEIAQLASRARAEQRALYVWMCL